MTRHYLRGTDSTAGGSSIPAVSPSFSALWAATTVLRKRLSTVATGGNYSGASFNSNLASGAAAACCQWVGEAALAAGVLEGTLTAVLTAREALASYDVQLMLSVRVVSADGGTVRGTLYEGVASALEVTSAGTATTRKVGPLTLTPVTAAAGDRLVIEVGGRRGAAGTAATGITVNSTDATGLADFAFADDLTGNTGREWVQFSQDVFTAAPTDLQAIAGTDFLTLEWSAVAGATGYDVRIDGGPVLDAAAATAYDFTGLTPATTYLLAVRARTAGGVTAWSTLSAATDALPPPAAPTGLAATPAIDAATLTWDPVPDAAGYDVRIDGGPVLEVGNVLLHTFTGLAADTTYTLEVRTYNAAGDSAWSALEVTTLAEPAVDYLTAVLLELGPEEAPVEVTGSAITIRATTGLSGEGAVNALEPGELVALVEDASLSPVDNPLCRPGQPIRLAVRDDDGRAAVWTGSLDRAVLDYPDRGARFRVTFTAYDVVADLAGLPSAVSTSGSFAQRVAHVLDPTGVGYDVVDSAPDAGTWVTLPTDASTALGQLTLARDTCHGMVHVGADGRVKAYADRDRPSAVPVVTFSDDLAEAGPDVLFYTHLDPSFDTADLVNVLEVTVLDTDPVTIIDADSVAAWRAVPSSVTVNEGDPEDHAIRFMAGRTTPALTIKRLQHNVTRRPLDAVRVAVNDCIAIRRAGLFDGYAQVLAIEHTITTRRWTVAYELRQLETLPIRWVDLPAGDWPSVFPAGLTWDDLVDWRPPTP